MENTAMLHWKTKEGKEPVASVMNDIHAFRLASQRSEERRLVLLLGIMGVLLFLTLSPHFLGGIVAQGKALVGRICILGVLACFVLGGLFAVRQANREKRLLPGWVWTWGVIIEASMPAATLLLLVMFSSIDPLKAVAAPWVLLYGMFAAANALRLNPKLSLLFGGLAASGQAGVILYAVHKAGGVEWSMVPYLTSYVIILLLTGIVGAFVSRELRNHVIASMEAADLKRRAELLQGELKAARQIQQSLFPRQALKIAGFEVIGWCKPATETGGDYYDWCQLPSKEGFAMLGDATGHGLGPALLIASCRAYVRADLPLNKDIAGFMNRLNTRLAHDTDGLHLVTFVGVLIDEQAGQVKLMSAGHCPSLLVRAATETVEQIKADGVPLGVTGGLPFQDPAPIQLQPGDRLLVYTDGITEAKDSEGKMYGIERLRQSVVSHSKLEGQAFVDALYRDAMDFSNNAAPKDDVTLLSIRRF
jgi:serine phosphatase RsbU (regulator of sigma subunit)